MIKTAPVLQLLWANGLGDGWFHSLSRMNLLAIPHLFDQVANCFLITLG